MLRGFFSSSFSPSSLIVAMCGFRGEHEVNAPHGKFFPIWCGNKKSGRKHRAIFSPMAAARAFRLRDGPDWLRNAKIADDGTARDHAERCSVRRRALAPGLVSASAPTTTTPERWAANWGMAFPV